jgi:chaperonin GroEL
LFRRGPRPVREGRHRSGAVTRLSLEHAASVAALLLTPEALVAEELIAQPGAIIAPGFGDVAEGLARPSSPV